MEQERPASDVHAPADGYLFIVTYGRSGSTVLLSVLNAIPGIVVRGENGHLCRALRQIVATVETAPDFVRRRAAVVVAPGDRPLALRDTLCTPADPWFGAERVDPDAVGRALCEAFVRTVLQVPAGTRVAGFKEIRYLDHVDDIADELDFLRRFFPGARFVFLTRDHRAVMASGWYVRMSRIVTARRLRAADAAFARYAARHPDICHALRHEDFAENPEAFRPLFAFLGEPFDRAAVAAILDRRLTHLTRPAAPTPATRLRNAALRARHLLRAALNR